MLIMHVWHGSNGDEKADCGDRHPITKTCPSNGFLPRAALIFIYSIRAGGSQSYYDMSGPDSGGAVNCQAPPTEWVLSDIRHGRLGLNLSAYRSEPSITRSKLKPSIAEMNG